MPTAGNMALLLATRRGLGADNTCGASTANPDSTPAITELVALAYKHSHVGTTSYRFYREVGVGVGTTAVGLGSGFFCSLITTLH